MAMTQKDLLKLVSGWLEKANIPYMITGAWSVIYYGRIRTSHDLDFLVEIKLTDTPKILKLIKKEGLDFLLQEGSVEAAIKNETMFNIIYLPTMDKIDFWILKNQEYDKVRLGRKVKVEAWGQTMWLSSAEDTIVQKLVWYSKSRIEKHLIDAAFVWQIQKSNLDMNYVSRWVQKLGLEEYMPELDKVDLEEHY